MSSAVGSVRRSRRQRLVSATAFSMVLVAGGWAVFHLTDTSSASAAPAPVALANCPQIAPLPPVGTNGSDGPETPSAGHSLRRGIVSVDFDDGFRSTYDNAIPVLQHYGIPSTQYIIAGAMTWPDYVTSSQVADMVRSGQEIGSHTMDHPDLTTLTSADVQSQLTASRRALEAVTGPAGQPLVCDLAYPYGASSPLTQDLASATYTSARTTATGFNGRGTSPYQIRTQDMTTSTTPAQVQQWIDTAVQNKWWLALVYHAVTPTAASDAAEGREYGTSPANLDAEMAMIQRSGLAPLTMSAALAEVRSQ